MSEAITPAVFERRKEFLIQARTAFNEFTGRCGITHSPYEVKPVLVFGRRYDSCRIAGEALGIAESVIAHCCQRGGKSRYWPRGCKRNAANLKPLRARSE